jgi:threonine/homoserine/homoserine lactone efflux protein
MTTQALLAWSALAAVLTITPGIDMALVARTAIARGRGPAVATSGGIVTGLLVWGVASALGVAALLAASATAYDALRLAGAAYLIWLGVQTFRRSGRLEPGEPSPRSNRSAFLIGMLSNITNPKIVVFYSTVMPGFISDGASVLGWSLVLAAIHGAMGLLWLSSYAWALDRGRGIFQRPRARLLIDRVTGTVLVAFGARLALERR